MNLRDPKHPWSRLLAAVRLMRDDRAATAPYGFATRVAALAFSSERHMTSLFERFAFRAVTVACLLALGSVVVNYKTLAGNPAIAMVEDNETGPHDDAIAVVLDITD